MFKQSDLLPLALAFGTTLLIVGLGYRWISNINLTQSAEGDIIKEDSILQDSDREAEGDLQLIPSTTDSTNSNEFVMPTIVPSGTSVNINGSANMNSINKALKKSFHRQFPGTAVTTSADGSEIAIEQLSMGNLDLAAIERPLNRAELAAGLAAVKINNFNHPSSEDGKGKSLELYYVYREPLNPDVEVFLGYVLSPEGQEITLDAYNR